VDVLTEYARAALAPTITRQFKAKDDKVHVIVLEPPLEQLLLERAQRGDLLPATLGFEPEESEEFIKAAATLTGQLLSDRKTPAILTSPVLRPSLFAFLSPLVSDLAVLSYNDIVPDATVEVIGQLKLELEAVTIV
jgi:flagellar biosynthesis protein FlhA